MNLLFTSAGRRVELLQAFRQALSGRGKVFAADVDPTAPTLYVADEGTLCPPVSNPSYVEYMLDFVKRKGIKAIVPLIDPELPVLARAQAMFKQAGCTVLVMDALSVDISTDKWLTAQFFTKHGIPTPATLLPDASERQLAALQFPVVVKPRSGSSGKDVVVCRSMAEVRAACEHVPNPIIQEFIQGEEITVDVLGDLAGRVINAVQRKRLKVRAGEVERGITIWDADVEALVVKAAEALKPVGCINLQCFLTMRGPVFTEVNARFGGGYPLAQAAGADFPAALVRALEGETLLPAVGRYERGVLLLRYDTAVVLKEADLIRA